MRISRLSKGVCHRLSTALWRARHEVIRLRVRDPLLPPAGLHSVGGGDFRAVGDDLLGLLAQLGGLRPHERVLDIGCGTGRLARPLTAYLATGSYDGLDIVGPSIAWCRGAYRDYPNVRFHHADLINRTYNPSGRVRAADYRVPFADASFDFVLLTSVFTHMLVRDTQNYLSEIARVLAPGGRVFATAFLLDESSRGAIEAKQADLSFRHPLDGCFAERGQAPEESLAYDRGVFARMAEAGGLCVDRFHPGSWRGGEGATYQDLLILGARPKAGAG